MKLKTRNWNLGIFVVLSALQAWAADVTLSVNPPIISLGETAQVKVEVRNAKRPGAPSFPQVDGLRFSGTGQSSNTSIINGKVDKSVSYTTTVYPQKTGEFQIGPFSYKVDGEVKQLAGQLKVVATSGDTSTAQSWNDVVFAKLTADREKVYVQEPFELTLSIYSRTDVQLAGNINLQGLPETGLSDVAWEEIPDRRREQIDGVLYDVRHFKTPMRAMGSGEFRFAPVVTVQVAAPQQRRSRDPFGFGLFDRVQTIPVELPVEEVAVNVLPLPGTGRPDGFSGAVGRFNFHVEADPIEVAPGDPVTLKMTIVGEGNYDRIQPPALPVNAPFRLFGDAIREQGKNGVRFEQVISPRDADVTEIPSIDFSFFDSGNETYRTISSPPIPITVLASSNNTAQLFVAKDSVVAAPADTPFATESDLQRITKWVRKQWELIRPWLWTLPAALGIGGILFIIQKVYHWRRKDTAWVRRQQAPKAARKAFRNATEAIHKNDTAAFYEALADAFTSYFGNRLNLPPGDVTPTVVLQALTQANVETEQAKSLFHQVEAARYGLSVSEHSADEMKNLKGDLERLLKAVEKTKL
ncbi:BatD family protein [Tichowtungia aerotolerans]|uniref:Protein BatD n=1 Tax=Tichowtungia aerotolerans TaxID=2697043 RepID=A0A6P1M884_9BACT|nr:BatD family protein [Tichowtungia aerotolerans]QHI70097.1 hypothetical protein GT409_11790 [Tichowtungia aerotolerans]